LWFSPAGDLDPALAEPAQIYAALGRLAGTASVLVARLGPAACTEVYGLTPDRSSALASVVKLYVLAELARQIGAGMHTWDEPMIIEDRYKTLPSGTFQTLPDGTRMSVREFANAMISVSDNTAADHLTALVGPLAVEATVASSGHHDPTLLQPFQSIKQNFQLTLMLTPEEQQGVHRRRPSAASARCWRATRAAIRAAIRARPGRGPSCPTGCNGSPRPTISASWPLVLKRYGEQPATRPVYDALAISPFFRDVPRRFSYVGFKGGGVPGVLTYVWILQRASDKAWMFVAVLLMDTVSALDGDRAAYVTRAARELAAR
jgi:hypothetical protein